jgi:hypothetical protein
VILSRWTPRLVDDLWRGYAGDNGTGVQDFEVGRLQLGNRAPTVSFLEWTEGWLRPPADIEQNSLNVSVEHIVKRLEG